MKQRTALVIGGGAAGMMATIVAARTGADVTLLEQNNILGKKLRITGGGRCNIYNAESNLRLLLQNYGEAEQSLYSAFTEFGAEQSREFFTDIGLDTKIEAKNRAFPVSERAEDVANAMVQELHRLGVTIRTSTRVSEMQASNGHIQGAVVNGNTIIADSYILATGGASKPETGSTGDGFEWLSKLGHNVNKPTPTITPLQVPTPWVRALSGTTLHGVTIAFIQSNKRQISLHGDVLCTHFGISGPLILNNAYKVATLLKKGDVRAEIDCYPNLDHKQLDTRIRQTLEQHPSKQTRNVMKDIVPTGMNQVIMDLLTSVDFDTKTSELSKEDRKQIVHLLKAMPIQVTGLMGFEKAVVADGGIDISDINMRTMRSNKLSNLFVTGDLLDIRRPSGGFSLQLCWTTGYLAGKNSSRNISS